MENSCYATKDSLTMHCCDAGAYTQAFPVDYTYAIHGAQNHTVNREHDTGTLVKLSTRHDSQECMRPHPSSRKPVLKHQFRGHSTLQLQAKRDPLTQAFKKSARLPEREMLIGNLTAVQPRSQLCRQIDASAKLNVNSSTLNDQCTTSPSDRSKERYTHSKNSSGS